MCKYKEEYLNLLNKIEDNAKPYSQKEFSNGFIREFNYLAPSHLFKWHFDEGDRIIEVREHNDWKFQFDNELPRPLIKNELIFIPKGVYHRIIKGSHNLEVFVSILK